jgi:hypothetical protein
MEEIRLTHLLKILLLVSATTSLSAWSALEDGLTSPGQNKRTADLEHLIRAIRSLQARGALSGELGEIVNDLDKMSDIAGLRAGLLNLLPDVTRQTYHRERRARFDVKPNDFLPSSNQPISGNSWGNVFWLDTSQTYQPATNLWLQSWNDTTEQDGVTGFNDFKADTTGYAIGIDRELTASWSLSLSLGEEVTNIDASIFGEDEVDSHRATIGLNYRRGRHFFGANWQQTRSETDRIRMLVVPTRTGFRRIVLNSDFDTKRDGTQISYATYFEPSSSFMITPFVTANYSQQDTDDYTERGSGKLSLSVTSDTASQFFGTAGLALSWLHFGETWSFSPSVTAVVEHDFDSDTTITTSQFQATNTHLVTTGQDLAATRWRAAASISLLYRDLAGFSLSYETDRKDNYSYEGVILTLQVRID